MDFFDKSNKKVNFTELVKNVSLTNNFLAVSDDDDPTQGAQQKTIVGDQSKKTPQGTAQTTAYELLKKSQADQQINN
jgi:hypothetical protein